MSPYEIDYTMEWAEKYQKQYIQAIDECLIRLMERAIKNSKHE